MLHYCTVCCCHDLSFELQRYEKCCTTCWNVIESLGQCGEIRDGNSVQNVCVCVQRLNHFPIPHCRPQLDRSWRQECMEGGLLLNIACLTLTNKSDPQQHPSKVKCVISVPVLKLAIVTAKLMIASKHVFFLPLLLCCCLSLAICLEWNI